MERIRLLALQLEHRRYREPKELSDKIVNLVRDIIETENQKILMKRLIY